MIFQFSLQLLWGPIYTLYMTWNILHSSYSVGLFESRNIQLQVDRLWQILRSFLLLKHHQALSGERVLPYLELPRHKCSALLLSLAFLCFDDQFWFLPTLIEPMHYVSFLMNHWNISDPFHKRHWCKRQVWSTNRCVLSIVFFTFNMDRRTDQQA